MNVYRVNYYLNGTPKSAFVVAGSAPEASDFIGVRDGSATTTEIARDVEVVGLDKPHTALAPTPVQVAPFQISKQFSEAEMQALRELLANAAKPVKK